MTADRVGDELARYADVLDRVESLGVDTIELSTLDLDLVVGGQVRHDRLATVKKMIAGRGTGYSVHGPLAINPMDEDWRLSRHMDVLKASLEVSAELGAEHYVVHAGLTPSLQSDSVEAAYGRQRDFLSKAGDLARDAGQILCVETLFGGYRGEAHTASPRRLARELELIGHDNVRATIDFSHSWLKQNYDGQRDDFVAGMAALAPWARHLHIHDSFGRQDDIWMYTDGERVAYGHGDLHLPVGWGDIPWRELIEACTFAPGVIFNIELNPRHVDAAAECVARTRELAEAARTGA